MNTFYSFDTDRQLFTYHIDAGGYCCFGIENARREASAIARWLGIDPPSITPDQAGFEAYQRILTAGAEHARRTGQRCDADLCPELIGLEGKRIEATNAFGERSRFIVGKSTGWLPCHLEIARRGCSGGPGAMGPYSDVKVIRG